MPTSARGSRPTPAAAAPLPLKGATPAAWRSQIRGVRWSERGFTLIELLVVMAIVAISAALISVALPDRTQDRLDEEAERLAALLESARTEARASGIAVRWELASAQSTDGDFRFVGLPPSIALPRRWMSEGVSAEIVGARAVTLGPEPVLPPQRIVLRLEDRRVVLASDGLAPFANAGTAAVTP